MLDSLMNDEWIISQSKDKSPEEAMIFPFVPVNVGKIPIQEISSDGHSVKVFKKVISYGVGGFGYDVRLDSKLRVFHSTHGGVVDPLDFNSERYFIDIEVNSRYAIPPHSCLLGKTIEYIRVPDDVIVLALGKSTYSRVGVSCSVPPADPGFHGTLTFLITNQLNVPVYIYPHQGICQLVFIKGKRPLVNYKDKGGKYLGQIDVTPAR